MKFNIDNINNMHYLHSDILFKNVNFLKLDRIGHDKLHHLKNKPKNKTKRTQYGYILIHFNSFHFYEEKKIPDHVCLPSSI